MAAILAVLKLGSNQDVLPKVKGQMNRGPSRQRSIIQRQNLIGYKALKDLEET